MMNFVEFHFLRPEWFWALPVLFLVAVFWWRRSLSRGNWAEVCDDRLLPYILDQPSDRQSRFPLLLFVLAAILSIIALAGPTWKRVAAPVYRNESALVIVLDLSKSMDAEDIQPSRLGRARFKISDILQQRKDGLTALVVYSDDAYTVTPLTDDHATISSQLPALDTSIMPTQGSRTSTALQRAVALLKQSGNLRGNILLITDSVDPKASEVAEKISREGYRLYVLGIGSEEGAPIPRGGRGFIKDAHGNIVVSRLQTRALDSLARMGGGYYQNLTLDDRDIRLFSQSFDHLMELPQVDRDGRQADQWIEEGPWLLLFIVPIAAFAFRRGYLFVLLFLTFPFPQAVYAWEWKDLWQTRDLQGHQAFLQGDYERAADLFDDPAWKAASEYSAGQYQKALETLNKLETEGTSYNEGNALARAGRFPEALEAYDQALELDPDDEDARYNRELIEKVMKQPKSSQNQSSEPGNSSDDSRSSPQNQGKAESTDSGTEQADQQAEASNPSDRAGESDNAQDAEKNHNSTPWEQDQPSPVTEQGNELKEPNTGGEQAIEPQQASAGQEHRPLVDADPTPEQELRQSNEQWLRRIPDDPGGLLRRKFKFQYQKNNPRPRSGGESW